jgi:hypothetical protein
MRRASVCAIVGGLILSSAAMGQVGERGGRSAIGRGERVEARERVVQQERRPVERGQAERREVERGEALARWRALPAQVRREIVTRHLDRQRSAGTMERRMIQRPMQDMRPERQQHQRRLQQDRRMQQDRQQAMRSFAGRGMVGGRELDRARAGQRGFGPALQPRSMQGGAREFRGPQDLRGQHRFGPQLRRQQFEPQQLREHRRVGVRGRGG